MAVGKIQRHPRGLLQLLGMVGSGVPPTAMADEVAANVEMLPFWGSELLAGRSADGTVTNRGDSVQLPVPVGKAWMLLGGQYTVVAGAVGEQALLTFAINLKNANTIRIDKMAAIQTAVAADARLGGAFALEHPILLTAGNGVQVFADDLNVAVARVANIACVVYEFDL